MDVDETSDIWTSHIIGCVLQVISVLFELGPHLITILLNFMFIAAGYCADQSHFHSQILN